MVSDKWLMDWACNLRVPGLNPGSIKCVQHWGVSHTVKKKDFKLKDIKKTYTYICM